MRLEKFYRPSPREEYSPEKVIDLNSGEVVDHLGMDTSLTVASFSLRALVAAGVDPTKSAIHTSSSRLESEEQLQNFAENLDDFQIVEQSNIPINE